MNDLKPGKTIEIDGNPYEVLEARHQKIARRSATVSAKLRNLRTEKVREITFHPNDNIKKADITKKEASFHHRTKDEFIFKTQKGEMVFLTDKNVGKKAAYLTKDLPITLVYINNAPEGIELPVKAQYTVTEAPPNVRGDTSQGGTKEVVLETGARVRTPLFIEQDDIIEINTETGEYVRRTNK